MESTNFTTAYKKLNRAQKMAVDTIEGPVMVVAGPGTGKTQILALRIANILKQTDTQPENILALTFTEAGASTMRERLMKMIGVTAYGVPMFTFHALAGEVIGRFPEYFIKLVGLRPMNQLDQIMLMQKVFDTLELKRLASPRSPYHYLEKTLVAISLLKREAILPEELSTRLDREAKAIHDSDDYRHQKGAHQGKIRGGYLKREEAMEKNRELVLLYTAYEKALARAKLYDYDDMVLMLVRALETNKKLKLILQEEYQYLLADEYQDGNGAQNKVLELLADFHDSPNIFIVGDERQAIYRFQGASHENFVQFRKKYPDAKVVTLTENYRSTQNILDAAGTKLSSNSRNKEALVHILECASVHDETEYMATEISKKIEQKIRPEEIAIFTRTNKELAVYASALTRRGVPVSVESKEDILDDIHIEKLLTLLTTTARVGEDFAFVQALHLDCFNIDELEMYELARAALRKKDSAWRLQVRGEILRVRELVLAWAKLGNNVSPAELVSAILRESGILAQILAHADAENKLEKLARLLHYLEEYTKTNRRARLQDIIKVLALLDEYNVLESTGGMRKQGRVQIMTAHKAKGLEFEHVYMAGVTEGNWSGKVSRTTFKLPGIVASTKEEEETDERNLFYVAMTRAKHELTISYATQRDDGASLIPSRFILEIPQSLIHRTPLCVSTQGSPVVRAGQILTPVRTAQTRKDIKDFVRETFLERGLAVTGLNNYLSCPWKYFYRNLLRIPEPQTVPLMFGNAIHRTLKRFFDKYSHHDNMSKSELLKTFDQELEREYFTDKELAQMRTGGHAALAGYYDFYKNSWSRDIENEFPIDSFLSVGDLEIRLTGKLDKIEMRENGNVSVVDYKTGNRKSRNEILGNTKNSEGDYHRQLVFYKLLLDRQQEGKYNMQTGTIDFIIPDKKSGRFSRETFEITKEQVQELEKKVQAAAHDILTLSFWNKRCGEKGCQYCKLRDIL